MDEMEKVAIPPYRSGQFGRGRAGSRRAAAPGGSQSHHTDQGNSDRYCRGRLRRPRPQVAIPPYRSGQFGHCTATGGCATKSRLRRNPTIQIRAIRTRSTPTALPLPGRKSQSHHTDQGNSDWDQGLRAVGKVPEKVAIPPYRSGQFGQRPLQVTDSARLKVPSAVTSRKCSSLRCHRLDFLLLSRIVTRSSSSGSVSGRYLRAKMAKAAWHDFCQACFLPSPPTARSPAVKESSTTPACPDASLRSA